MKHDFNSMKIDLQCPLALSSQRFLFGVTCSEVIEGYFESRDTDVLCRSSQS